MPSRIDTALVASLVEKVERLMQTDSPAAILVALAQDHGARRRFVSGTEELKMAKVTGQCTAGGVGLLQAWCRRARVALDRAQGES